MKKVIKKDIYSLIKLRELEFNNDEIIRKRFSRGVVYVFEYIIKNKPIHPFEWIFNPFMNKTIKIDIELVDMIKYLWNNKIETIACCQCTSNNNKWIKFKSKDDFYKFEQLNLNISIKRGMNSVYY